MPITTPTLRSQPMIERSEYSLIWAARSQGRGDRLPQRLDSVCGSSTNRAPTGRRVRRRMPSTSSCQGNGGETVRAAGAAACLLPPRRGRNNASARRGPVSGQGGWSRQGRAGPRTSADAVACTIKSGRGCWSHVSFRPRRGDIAAA